MTAPLAVTDCSREIKRRFFLGRKTVTNLDGILKYRGVQSPDREDPLEESMATHSSILAWSIQWTEEPGGLQFMGLQRVGHNKQFDSPKSNLLYFLLLY